MRQTGAVRIALVHYTYVPVVAGVELVMAEQARVLAEAGHDLTIICGNDDQAGQVRTGWTTYPLPPGIVPDSLLAAGADVFLPPPPQPRRIVLGALAADSPDTAVAHAALAGGTVRPAFAAAVSTMKMRLRAVLDAQDVVILHNVATMPFQLALTAALWELADELPAVRFICWVHDLAGCNPDYEPLPLGREPWSLLARAHPRFEYVAVSPLRQRQFATLTGSPESRCLVIPNGVEPRQVLDLPESIATLERAYALLDRDVILLQPARLLRRKNVELALRLTAAIKAAGRSCACLITAPPDVQNAPSTYEPELDELHAHLGLHEDAFFLNDRGPLRADEMRGLFSLADALFFPSRQEGFGLPLLEAALHRLPIFCSNIEPLNSLLASGVTTFSLATPPDQIATLLLQNLDSDPAHRARKQTLRTYSWRAIYRNFLAPLLAQTDTRPRL